MDEAQTHSIQDAGCLFDSGWYVSRYPECTDSGTRPEDHYQDVGDALGYWPNALFDPAFYSRQYPELPASGGARLIHYFSEGEAAGAKPNICFDPVFYRKNYPDLETLKRPLLFHYLLHGGREGRNPSLLFDGRWYRTVASQLAPDSSNGDLAAFLKWVAASDFGNGDAAVMNPVAHYLHVGEGFGLQPHPLFDPGYYCSQPQTEDLAGKGALAHYLENGDADDGDPHPLFQAQFYMDQFEMDSAPDSNLLIHYLNHGEPKGKLPNPLFDPGHYLELNPDLSMLKVPLLQHYASSGARELRATSLLFDARWYTGEHPEAATQPGGPLAYYLTEGDKLGHNPHPLFDASLYGSQHPELPNERGARVRHFVMVGGHDGSNPHPLFHSTFYLSQNPTLNRSGESLLFHYIREGEALGLLPNPVFDPNYYGAHPAPLQALPFSKLEHFCRWGEEVNRDPSAFFDLQWVRAKLRERNLPTDAILGTYLSDSERFPVSIHPLFDQTWYRNECPADELLETDPLRHFLDGGWRSGISPTPFFEMEWYRDSYAFALDSDKNPLLHYLEEGEKKGLQPNVFFDPKHYRDEYSLDPRNPKTALEQFVRVGIARGHRPGKLFDFCIGFFRDQDPGRRHSRSNPARGYFYGEYSERISPSSELPVQFSDCDNPKATIIIPAYGQLIYTLACLRSLASAHTETPFEVLLVDDASPHGELDPLKEIPNLRILTNKKNVGFLYSCNRGAKKARGEYLVFLNNDTLVTDQWLDELVKQRDAFPDTGLTGSRLLFPTGKLQEAGSIVFSDATANNCGWGKAVAEPIYSFARLTDYVSAAAMAIRADLFKKIGRFDTHFAPAYYEDTDLAFRVRESGKDVVYQPASTVIHFGGASHGRDLNSTLKSNQVRNQKLFAERWKEVLQEHPPLPDSRELAALRLDKPRALVFDATMLTPDRDSGSLRMFNLMQVLRTMGYSVTFISKDLRPLKGYLEDLQENGIHVICAPHVTSHVKYLEQYGSEFQVCIISRPDTALVWMERTRLLCPNARVLYDTVDLHFLRRERELRTTGRVIGNGYRKEDELRAVRQADAALVVSEVEQQKLRKEAPDADVYVVSNIHRTTPPDLPFDDRTDLLFVGGFGHPPNEDAVRWFVRHVFPLVSEEIPDIRLHVVGSNPDEELLELASEQVLFWGFVPDLSEHLASRRVSVAPLRYGAGIKGKVNEAMAHGLPCVATSVAAEGILATDGEGILVADDPEAFAAAVAKLYQSRELWERISEASLASVERQCSFEVAEHALRAAISPNTLPSS